MLDTGQCIVMILSLCAMYRLEPRVSARCGRNLFRPSLPYYPFSYLGPEACIPRPLLLDRLITLLWSSNLLTWLKLRSGPGAKFGFDIYIYTQAQPKVSMLALCELSCVAGSLSCAV